MTKHMPEAPAANRQQEGPWEPSTRSLATRRMRSAPTIPNASEQGDTANIKRNTANKGFLPRVDAITKEYSYV